MMSARCYALCKVPTSTWGAIWPEAWYDQAAAIVVVVVVVVAVVAVS